LDPISIALEFTRVLIWPCTLVMLILLYRTDIREFIKRLTGLNLPGGASLQAFPNDLETGKRLSAKVEATMSTDARRLQPAIPLTDANARMLNRSLAPSPSGLDLTYYRELAEQDPNLALAGLRIEIETMLKNVATGFQRSIGQRDSAGVIARKLREQGAITTEQFEYLMVVVRLCNAAIHGYKATKQEAEEVLDIASHLVEQYLSWLEWGFPDKPA